MRLIDADKFKENILSGLYVFCQENKEDIARAIDDEPTIHELPEKYIIKVKTKADAQKIKDVWDKYKYKNPIIVSENFDITPIIPQGEWIKKVDNVGFISHICSECGSEIEVEDPCDNKFCFSCGADMRGEQNG